MKIDCTLTDRGQLKFRLCDHDWLIDPLDVMERLITIDDVNSGADRATSNGWLRDTAKMMVELGSLPTPPTLYEAEVFYVLVCEVYGELKKKRQAVVQTCVASLTGTTSTPAAGPGSSATRGCTT